jgi:hypothetical protein
VKYLVIDGIRHRKGFQFTYRGVNRTPPPYCSSLPANHEFNQLWLYAAEEEQSGGGIRDLAKAQRYAELSNENFSEMRFDVIGISPDSEPVPEVAKFLGYDIGSGDSLIVLTALPSGPIEETGDDPAAILNELIRRHFYPKLNEFGLFRTREDAAECRHAMIALQSLRPNFYEGGALELFKQMFKVTGVYLISGPN